jgi:hypothetical protein
MQALFELAYDIGEVRERALLGVKNVHALNAIPQLALLLEVHSVALAVALNQHAEKGKEELQVFLGRFQRKRIDGEVPRILTDIQVRSAKD